METFFFLKRTLEEEGTLLSPCFGCAAPSCFSGRAGERTLHGAHPGECRGHSADVFIWEIPVDNAPTGPFMILLWDPQAAYQCHSTRPSAGTFPVTFWWV